MTNKEAIEKIDRVFRDLGVDCAYDMPSFWAKDKKGKSKYVVIPDKYHKGYQQALEYAEMRIKEIFEEAENETNYESGKASADRPTGEWYYSCQNGWHCSICQQTVKDMPTVMGKANFNYCPNCGAKMKEAEK